jgi:hypothetical protein
VSDGLTVLGRLLTGAGLAAAGLLVLVSLGGVMALAIGLAAWHDPLPAIVVVILVAPCIVAPQVLRRRVQDLVQTATHPAQAASQARDLLSRVQPGGELRAQVEHLRSAASARHRGRLRSAVGVARATSGVLALAEPDPERHRLLLPLRPERVALLSTWALASFWGAVVAVFVTFAAVAALLGRAIT